VNSLRRRLTLVLALGFGALAAGGGVALDAAVSARATDGLDDAIAAKLRALVALTEEEDGRIELDYTPASMPEYERDVRPEYHQFWLDDGRVLLRSKHLGTGDLPGPDRARATPVFADTRLPDGRAGRVGLLLFTPHRAAKAEGTGGTERRDAEDRVLVAGSRSVVVAVARDREDLDRMLGAVRTVLLGIVGGGALLAALFAWRALARGFRPLDDVAARVATLDVDRLSDRIVAPAGVGELAPMVTQLNALLTRLEAARDRERRFTGNVAHELRTPIAELRSLASVGRRWPADAASVEGFFRDVDAIGGRMEGLVRDLLLLARCQSGAEPIEPSLIDLRELLLAEAPRAGAASASFVEVPDGLMVRSDPGRLGIVLRNLLANAAAHRVPGGEIRCLAVASGGRFRLEVRNPAERLSEEDLRRLTEPFWRRDAARTSSDHVGLGLAIVAALARLLGLDVSFDQEADGTFAARVEGPAVEPPGVASPRPVADPSLSRS
jgi:two-component system sensor histidine kinase QseC